MFQVFTHMTSDAPVSELEMRWLIGAEKLAAISGRFVNSVRGLGRLDACLRQLAPEYFDWITEPKLGQSMNVLEDYDTLSALWVMGAYEVLRSLAKKLNKASAPYPHV